MSSQGSTSGFWTGFRDGITGRRSPASNVFNVKAITEVPKDQVAKVVEGLKLDPRYIGHRVVQYGDKFEITAILRPE